MGYHAFRLRARSIITFICIMAVVAVGLVMLTSEDQLAMPAWSIFRKAAAGATDAERLQYLSENGWQADEKPLAAEELTIPKEFDEVYEQYNAIQQAQGFNLQKWAGKTVTEYTYHITNYPGDDNVVAHLLVFKDRIIGADISSTEQGGFVSAVKQPKE